MASMTDIGVPLVVLAWLLFGVSTIIVAMRIWVRVFHLKTRLAGHDWLILCAVISEIVHAVLLTMAVKYGLGKHIGRLSAQEISTTVHYSFVSESFSITTSYFGRISFAVFLLSVLGNTAKTRRNILYSLIVIDTLINAICLIQIYAQCGTHIDAFWRPEVAAMGYCENPKVELYISYVQASTNSFADLVLTIIPITIVYKLKFPMATKLGLGALLTLSSFALIASVAKAVEIQQLANGPDFTYHFATLQYCVVFENDIVVIAGSVPMLRALWMKKPEIETGPRQYYSSGSAMSYGGGKPGRMYRLGSQDESSMVEKGPPVPLKTITMTTETNMHFAKGNGSGSFVGVKSTASRV